MKPHCHRYIGTMVSGHHKKCQVECSKGANHTIPNKVKVHKFKSCDPDTARSKIANAFPGETNLPQPWVHPTFSTAYHPGETVLLAQPVHIPTSDTDTVTTCPVAWSVRELPHVG